MGATSIASLDEALRSKILGYLSFRDCLTFCLTGKGSLEVVERYAEQYVDALVDEMVDDADRYRRDLAQQAHENASYRLLMTKTHFVPLRKRAVPSELFSTRWIEEQFMLPDGKRFLFQVKGTSQELPKKIYIWDSTSAPAEAFRELVLSKGEDEEEVPRFHITHCWTVSGRIVCEMGVRDQIRLAVWKDNCDHTEPVLQQSIPDPSEIPLVSQCCGLESVFFCTKPAESEYTLFHEFNVVKGTLGTMPLEVLKDGCLMHMVVMGNAMFAVLEESFVIIGGPRLNQLHARRPLLHQRIRLSVIRMKMLYPYIVLETRRRYGADATVTLMRVDMKTRSLSLVPGKAFDGNLFDLQNWAIVDNTYIFVHGFDYRGDGEHELRELHFKRQKYRRQTECDSISTMERVGKELVTLQEGRAGVALVSYLVDVTPSWRR